MTSRNLLIILFCFILSGLTTSAEAAEKSVDISLDVGAHKWAGIRLTNIQKDTRLDTHLTIDGDAEIFLLTSAQYSRFPALNNKPIFHAAVSKKLDFSLTISETDSYVMVVDNRNGNRPLSFSFHFDAFLDTNTLKKQTQQSRLKLKQINAHLTRFSKTLQKAFIFDDIEIKLVKCGKSNAYSTSTAIFLCAEYLQALARKVSDKQQIQQILLFTLMHEMGHILLKKWDYPFADNEELIDEFATVVLIMFNQKKAASVQADFFASVPAEQELKITLNQGSRHPLSIQRARNIRRWLSSTEIVQKWQKLLIPFMQTTFLRLLLTQSTKWINKDEVIRELRKR